MNPLFVPELLHSILECISLSSSDGPIALEERKTLVALARTCSTLSEPSLDCLWQCLDSLRPLIRSFADGVVDNSRFETPPSPQEWLIINRHSPRIRKLSLGADHLSLRFLQCTNLVLPNLRALKWGNPFFSINSNSNIHCIWPLLTRIVTLELGLKSIASSGPQSLLENFTSLCPNVKSISITAYSLGGLALVSSTEALSQAVCGRTDWERVELSCAVDDVALKHLGVLSTLKEVSLTLAPESDAKELEHTGVPFRNVTRLALTVWERIDIATNLLRAQDQAFRTFRLKLCNIDTTTTDVSAFMAAIVSPERAHSLRSLKVTVSRFQDFLGINTLNGDLPELPFDTFHPITSLVHLRELVFDLNHSITINDDEFASLVRNWPQLELFWLTGKCEASAKSISLKGLLSLLVSCPKLQEIALSLDARWVPSDADVTFVAAAGLCWPSVTRLIFQDSLIDDPELVADFLLKYLPGVHRVGTPFHALPLLDRRRLIPLWSRMDSHMQSRVSVH